MARRNATNGGLYRILLKAPKIEIDLKAENRGFTKKELLKMGIKGTNFKDL